ncbi:hypothetical protein SLEP1_g48733 [Rubroshorea leprosula]|uniref:G domain-containing protein n=1 Tax=Rubroshorea leprosula TaxID=152421 RepID=A0AAV5LUK7_9ROSI|nr:hypothetical protein SLEP1_g48733 [Rubroshorea leprosula]
MKAFHACINRSFCKGSLLSALTQLVFLTSDEQAISVGFVGYPNDGKSSVINTRPKNVLPLYGFFCCIIHENLCFYALEC